MNENKIVNVSPYLVTEKRDKLLKDCDHEYVTKRGCFDIIDNEVHSENNYESSLCCEMLSLPTFKCLHCTRLLTAPIIVHQCNVHQCHHSFQFGMNSLEVNKLEALCASSHKLTP